MKGIVLLTATFFSLTACTHQQRHHLGGGGNMDKMHKEGSMMGGKGDGMGRMKGMMNADMHEKMAQMHEDMASCLKSGKSQEECQMKMKDKKQMMCQEMGMMKDCPMMGQGASKEEMEKSDNNSGDKSEHEEHH